MGSLQNIQINEVKSILIYKCSIAVQHEIKTSIEVREIIEKIGISTVIVCQMLGILLDNAVEAILEADEKNLLIAVVKNPKSKTFIIKNNWKRRDIPINQLFELGFSTKSEGRGVGLHTIRSYTERLKGLYLETELDEYFTQILTVKDE
jgi:two-component system sensor histidine kinase AgrC